MNKIFKGGWCPGQRTYIMAAAGIISAVTAYLVGDVDLFITMQTIFTLGSIYFVRKKMDERG
jgi:hypothetical protein